MSLLKFGHAAVVNKVVCPGKWVDNVVPKSRLVVAKNVIAQFDPAKWLLSHVTIMASVDVEKQSNDPKKNYLIKPEYSMFVNNNGDSWERELLKKAAKTFLGADNYVEHIQIPALSKGKVIDVAIREVPFEKDQEGNDLTTLYVDILIGTNKKHVDLVDKINSGEYNATSMGCLIEYSICSQCGNIAKDDSHACQHVRYFKKNYFYDDKGVKRIVAELCGSSDDPNSCKFIDASWVRQPAFEGAVLNKVLPYSVGLSEKIQKAVAVPSFEYIPGMYLKAASEEASDIVRKLAADENAAPEPPKDDFNFPEAPEESNKDLTVDTPPAEAESDSIPPAEGDTSSDTGALGTPNMTQSLGGALPQEPQINEPKSDASVEEVRDLFKRQILNEIRRDILKQQAKEEGLDNQRPSEIENESNDNLVSKSASYNRILKAAKEQDNDRLYNGLMILANLKDWKQFKKYGYNREDVLGLLYFMDKNSSEKQVGSDAIRALSKIKLGSEGLVPFFTKIIVEIGRKPYGYENIKLAKWAKILNNLE